MFGIFKKIAEIFTFVSDIDSPQMYKMAAGNVRKKMKEVQKIGTCSKALFDILNQRNEELEDGISHYAFCVMEAEKEVLLYQESAEMMAEQGEKPKENMTLLNRHIESYENIIKDLDELCRQEDLQDTYEQAEDFFEHYQAKLQQLKRLLDEGCPIDEHYENWISRLEWYQEKLQSREKQKEQLCKEIQKQQSDHQQIINKIAGQIRSNEKKKNRYQKFMEEVKREQGQYAVLVKQIQKLLHEEEIRKDWEKLQEEWNDCQQFAEQQCVELDEQNEKFEHMNKLFENRNLIYRELKKKLEAARIDFREVPEMITFLTDLLDKKNRYLNQIKNGRQEIETLRTQIMEHRKRNAERADLEKAQFADVYKKLGRAAKDYIDWKKALELKEDFTCFRKIYEHPYCEDSLNGIYDREMLALRTLDEYQEFYNNCYIRDRLEEYGTYFDNIDGKMLDLEQRIAVLTDEDYTQVIAGAGCGKSITILAKVKYLVEKKKIEPQKILLLASAKHTADKMKKRIHNKMGIPVEIKTFTELGMDIIRNSAREQNFLSEELLVLVSASLVEECVFRLIQKDSGFAKNLLEFAFFYQIQPKSRYEFESIQIYDAMLRQVGEDSLKSILEQSDEQISDYEEWVIANYLYIHGISYEYQKILPQYLQEGSDESSNRVCFYLPDYDLYWEHFGLNRQRQIPYLSAKEESDYQFGMQGKINLFKKYQKPLIVTYSFYFENGGIYQKIEQIFEQYEIQKQEVDFQKIAVALLTEKKNQLFSNCLNLMNSYLVNYKSNLYGIEDMEKEMEKSLADCHAVFEHRRTELFFSCFETFLEDYQTKLLECGKIDLNDMLAKAANLILQGDYLPDYNYVIVDEFQDMSYSRYCLLDALVRHKQGTKLFAIGDDWQAVRHLAGSDLDYFVHFEEYWNHPKQLRIEKNYRNPQELLDLGSRFVMKNPNQLKKHLISGMKKQQKYPVIVIEYHEGDQEKSQREQAFVEALKCIPEEKRNTRRFMVLGRNEADLDGYRRIVREDYLLKTVHASKGLEADYVILVDVVDDICGFPNKMQEDVLLRSLPEKQEDYVYAEERRLFYVALTRSRNQVLITTPAERKSVFVKEIQQDTEHVCTIRL